MKLIAFFSRFTFICNLCFVLFVIFSIIQSSATGNATPGTVTKLPFFKDLVIILGFLAIVINLVMCITYLVVFALKKKLVLPKWLTIVNIVFLPIQFFYFFFYK
ncbi:MAG TPA: hypothetical protein VFD44_05745 [Hanamia sp.]|nr:hypothetical protein [Hanamia sp.]